MEQPKKHIKVAVSERLPEVKKDVVLIYDDDKLATGFHSGTYWWIYDAECQQPEFFLEEVPDRESELIEMLEKLRSDIKTLESEANTTAKSLNQRGMEASHYSSKAMAWAYKVSSEKIDSLIQSVKQPK